MNDDILSVLMKQCMEFPSLKMNGKRPTTSKLLSCVPVSYYFSEQTNCYLDLAFIKTQRGREESIILLFIRLVHSYQTS